MVALESANLFRSLSPDKLPALRSIAQERRFTAGSEICREGDAADGVYVIQDGQVEISAAVGPDTRLVLSQLDPGGFFSEMAFVEGQRQSSTATALKDTRAWFIPRAGLLALLQHSPAFACVALQEVGRRLLEFDRLRLREAVDVARRAAIVNFARTINHDLKTPLTIIGLSAEIAGAPGAMPEKRLQCQEQIQKQIQRINVMLGDLLDFIGRASVPAAFKPAAYPDFIAMLLPELRAGAAAKSLVIEVQNDPPAGKVLMDAQRLRRVFLKLLEHATGTSSGGGKILLRFRAGDGGIVTEFEDTGRTPAPEMLEQLFEPFAPRGKLRIGALDLPLCRKIIEDHRGRLWARSGSGQGTVFCFTLPLTT